MMWKHKKTEINEYQETKMDKIIERSFVIGLSLVILLVLLMGTYINSHAESAPDLPSGLPYYFENNFNTRFPYFAQNTTAYTNLKSAITQYFGSTNNCMYLMEVYYREGNWISVRVYEVRFTNNFQNISTGASVSYDDFTWGRDCLYWSDNSTRYKNFKVYDNGTVSSNGSLGQQIFTIKIFSQDTKSQNISLYYPVYYTGSWLYLNQADKPIIASAYVPPAITPSTPTAPNQLTNNNTKPTLPNITSYTPTIYNPPSINTSSILDLVESFIDIFKYTFSWLLTNLSDIISNVIYNFRQFQEFFGLLLDYWLDWIVLNIQNLGTTFYNNMVSLFSPFFDNFESVFNFFLSMSGDGIIADIIGFFSDVLDPSSNNSLPDLIADVISAITGYSVSFTSLTDYFDDFYDNYLKPFFDSWARVISFFVGLYGLGLNNNNEFSIAVFLSRLIIPDHAQFVNMVVSHDNFHMISSVSHVIDEMSGFYVSLVNYSNYSVKTLTVPSFTAFGVTVPPIVIDFSWFDNYKTYSDTIISAFLIIGYFYWLFTRFSGILNHTSAPNIK